MNSKIRFTLICAALAAMLIGTCAFAQQNPNMWFSPCGGETVRKNQTFTVCWDYSGPAVSQFMIGLSNNGGQSFDYTLATVPRGSREWTGSVQHSRPDYPCNGSFNDKIRVLAIIPGQPYRASNPNPGGNFRIACAQ
jgi:hypothetical protein